MVSLTSITPLLGPEQEVGEGFRPTDHELVNHFLKLIIVGDHHRVSRIPVVDFYKYDPWDLPYCSGSSLSGSEWYFFHHNNLRKGGRAKRSTRSGYWKSTGRARKVEHQVTRKTTGQKKSLVFHVGRTPKGVGTEWIMHEYSAKMDLPNQGDFVLCKLIKRSKKKPTIRHDDGLDDQLDVVGPYRGIRNTNLTDQYLSCLEGIEEFGHISEMDIGLQNQNSDLTVDDTKITGEGGTGWLMTSEPVTYADDPILEELDAQILWNLWPSCGYNELNYTSSSATESNVHELLEFDNGFEDFLVSTKEQRPSSPTDFASTIDERRQVESANAGTLASEIK